MLTAVLLCFGAAAPIVPPDVTRWLAELAHRDLAVRRAAMASLRGRGEGVMPLLRRLAVGGADVEVRVRAAAVLGEIRSELFERPRLFAGIGPAGDGDLAVSPDGRLALSGGHEVLKLWDLERGTLLARLRGHESGVVAVAFAPDGRAAASGDSGGRVVLWDVKRRAALARFRPRDGAVWCVAFSSNGKALYAGTSSGVVIAYALDGEVRWRRTLGTGGVRAVALAPGGKAVFGTMDAKAHVLELDAGKSVLTFDKHTMGVMTVAVSADGKTAASAGMDGWVRLWSVADGVQSARFSPGEWVKSVAFTPDGRRLLSCGHRGVVQLWDVAAGKPAHACASPGDPRPEAWSLRPSRRGVLAAYADGTLKEWRLPE